VSANDLNRFFVRAGVKRVQQIPHRPRQPVRPGQHENVAASNASMAFASSFRAVTTADVAVDSFAGQSEAAESFADFIGSGTARKQRAASCHQGGAG
jgi:hypothetical protein